MFTNPLLVPVQGQINPTRPHTGVGSRDGGLQGKVLESLHHDGAADMIRKSKDSGCHLSQLISNHYSNDNKAMRLRSECLTVVKMSVLIFWDVVL